MTQPPGPAKRMRSNTSNDFTNATPPTSAPALRQQSNSNPAVVSGVGVNIGVGVGLYTPTAYNGNYGPLSLSHQARQNASYASYQPNGYPDTFSGHPTTYAESYDPNSTAFVAAYTQPSPGDNGSPYQQNAIDHISYATQARGRQSTSTVQGSYSPSPITPNTSTASYADVQNRSVTPINTHHSLPTTYEESYSSQSIPHNPQYHGPVASYPESTVNPHYSPPPPPQLHHQTSGHEEQGSPEQVVEANDGSEDAHGELVDADEVGEASNPPADEDPRKPTETKCACKKGRGKKKACQSCACSKHGRKCGKQCSCGSNCGNPFRDLTTFFGSADKFPKPCEANPCFATWLSNQPNVEELDVDLMVDMLLYDDKSWANIKSYTKPFKEWEDRWLKAKNAKAKKIREGRQELEFELLRGALGNCNADDFHGYWYSFCRGQWVAVDHWEHCRECRMCVSSNEWHCEQHGKCTSNRICLGCTGEVGSYPETTIYPALA